MSGDGEYWEKNARRYDRATLLLNKNFSGMAQAVADAVAGSEDVLEIAAGTGLVTAAVVPVVGRHIATDRSPEMLEVLRGRLDGQANLEVRTADALDLDFEDGTFDAVLVCNLLHLLPEPWWRWPKLGVSSGPEDACSLPPSATGRV
ncbi:MAG TPA: class I SAM-dependent methyltransferase [Myxococcota bacterium]|nr:class I SAM-dependent methyltransferase [Myxococcota bacterium]